MSTPNVSIACMCSSCGSATLLFSVMNRGWSSVPQQDDAARDNSSTLQTASEKPPLVAPVAAVKKKQLLGLSGVEGYRYLFLWKSEFHLHVTQFSWNQCSCECCASFLTETESPAAPNVFVAVFRRFYANVVLSGGSTKLQTLCLWKDQSGCFTREKYSVLLHEPNVD